jgi:hypothetical protein
MYTALETFYGHQLDVNPVLHVWEVSEGLNHGMWGIVVPTYELFAGNVISHEIAHWLHCAGGGCDYYQYCWMWEGFASFAGKQALNALRGDPDFRYAPAHATLLPPSDASLTVPLQDTPWEELKETGQQYSTAEMFWYLLCEVTSYENVTSVISRNHGRQGISDLTVIDDLQTISGVDLSPWVAGWLYESGGVFHRDITTEHYQDTDGDGLADFQELLRGTNVMDADSDEDGYSDSYELQHGYNPLDHSSKPAAGSTSAVAAFDGIPFEFEAAHAGGLATVSFSFFPSEGYEALSGLVEQVLCVIEDSSSSSSSSSLSNRQVSCTVIYNPAVSVLMDRVQHRGDNMRIDVDDKYVALLNQFRDPYNASPFTWEYEGLPKDSVRLKETNYGMEFTAVAFNTEGTVDCKIVHESFYTLALTVEI